MGYKHSICFVIPYIGKLPEYFPLWLATCKQNPSVDFLFLTDDKTPYNYPANVIVKYTTLDELRQAFQQAVDFPICLDRPYKLCDFRVAYGEVFARLLVGYDFWGHCDTDQFWGDIRHFLTPDIFDRYDRVLTHGHCTLYRNSNTVNRYYKDLDPKGFQRYTDVFATPESCCFDEWGKHMGGGISCIIEANGISQYDEAIIGDILPPDIHKNPASSLFILAQGIDCGKSRGRIFELAHGKCISHYCKNGELRTEEYLYAHFQRRFPRIESGVDENHFLLVPGARIVPAEPITKACLDRFTKNPRLIFEWLHYSYCSIKRIISRRLPRLRRQ